MTLPSSPPLLPEPDLPSSPGSLHLRPSNTLPKGLKRQLSDYASQQSSDPLFSDTPSDAEQQLEHESQPKRKKLVKGPWWNVRRPESGRGLRRRLSTRKKLRNFDSGVWMGSDSSEASNESVISDQQRLECLLAQEDDDHDVIPDSEAIAVDFIRQCLDQGKERVDLSDLGLYSISNATLRPLHQLIRHSHEDLTEPPSEDEFEPFTPSIQLYLSRNSLSSLPTQLFDLAHLTVLSLRSNLLARLPPAIGRLQSLEQLNVSGNCLEFLPWELLGLFHCRREHRTIIVRPNPLVDPLDFCKAPSLLSHESTQSHLVEDGDLSASVHRRSPDPRNIEQRLGLFNERLQLGRQLQHQSLLNPVRLGHELHLCNHHLIYLASSQVRYFGVDGTPLRPPNGSSRPASDFSAVLDPARHLPTLALTTRVPSLYELSLRSLQTKFDLRNAAATLSDDIPLSRNVAASLETAATNVAEFGNERCSTCEKEMIIPRAEWMEFWFNGDLSHNTVTRDTTFPFLRKACSWACATPSEIGTFRLCGL